MKLVGHLGYLETRGQERRELALRDRGLGGPSGPAEPIACARPCRRAISDSVAPPSSALLMMLMLVFEQIWQRRPTRQLP